MEPKRSEIQKRWNRFYGYLSTLVLAFSLPGITHAEPSASGSHRPFLWLVVIGVSAFVTWIVVKSVSRSGRLQSPGRKWGLAVVLFFVLLVFSSPIIVGLGSILITGRTM
jgi:amino acid transporter